MQQQDTVIDNSNACMGHLIEKINSELYFDGKVNIGDFYSKKPGVIKQIKGFFLGIHYLQNSIAPIILETEKVSSSEEINSSYNSHPIKTKIGEIQTYGGMCILGEPKYDYLNETTIKLSTELPLEDRVIPPFKIHIQQKISLSNKEDKNTKYQTTPNIPSEIMDNIKVDKLDLYGAYIRAQFFNQNIQEIIHKTFKPL